MNKLLSRIRGPLALLILAVCLAPVPSVAAQAQEPLKIQITQVDTTHFPLVKVYVSVIGSNGEPVPVDVARLAVSEDGMVIPAQEASGIGDSEPLTTLLVIDTSGSMRYADKLPAAKSAALAYVEQMQSWEKAGLISFNTVITYTQSITADRNTLKTAIDDLQASQNDTSMYDALAKAEEILQSETGRKAVIVLTDGMDNRSKNTVDSVVAGMDMAGLSISTVALGEPLEGKVVLTGVDESALRTLASQAGGSFGYAIDAAALQSLYEQLGRTLHSEYVITYSSPAALRDGVNRALSVHLDPAIPALAGTTSYNPGGLVPEVNASSAWPIFLILLCVLVAMMAVPTVIRWFNTRVQAGTRTGPKPAAQPAKPRIRLEKDAPAHRIKIH